MSRAITPAVPRRSFRKEAIVTVAAVGIAIVVWNFRDKISDFWNYLAFSRPTNSAPTSEREKIDPSKTAPESWDAQKSADIAPESVKVPASDEKHEQPTEQQPKEIVGNLAPESTEKNAPSSSVYVGLPKADPATVSASIPPSQWPGATMPQ